MSFAALCFLPAALRAQVLGSVNSMGINPATGVAWVVAGKVTTLQGDPVYNAKVEIRPINANAKYRTLQTDFQGEFRTDYFINAASDLRLNVELTVTKKGFLKAYALVDLGAASNKYRAIHVTLRDETEDPAFLSQGDLLSSLAPRLKNLGAADGLSASGEKDYARGVEEFFDRKRPDWALPHFKQVALHDSSCVGCLTMLALAELEAGDWDGAHGDLGEAANRTLADRSQGRPEPLLAYGVMESWRHEPKNATGFLVEALKFTPQDPLALQEIGRAQLQLENWGAAKEYLEKAMAAGARPEVRLLLVEALLGEGDFERASQEMTRYLDGRDVKTMPLPVRQLWARVAEKNKVAAAYIKVKSSDTLPIDYLHRAIPGLKDFVPAKDQAPLDSLLSAVGKNVEAYFRNFPNTVSLEVIRQEKLGHKGKVGETLDRKFHYLCLMPPEEAGPGFDEYRTIVAGEADQPQALKDGYMLTSGFASTSLIFHPLYQAESTFKYLGQQNVNGRNTFVIAYAERPEKARINGLFKMGATSMTTFSQGLAWVDAQNYQIIRMRTDLLRPLPEVRLDRETTEIDFGENHFKSAAEGFWLPREVTVSVDWNGKSLRNKHEYSDFKLFNVGATEKIGKPKALGQTSKQETPAQTPN